MFSFKRLGVPIVDEKTEGPVTSMNFFGLTINNESMCVKIPEETFKELFKKLNECEFKKKVTLNQLQSLCGSLAFLHSCIVSRPCIQQSSIFSYC